MPHITSGLSDAVKAAFKNNTDNNSENNSSENNNDPQEEDNEVISRDLRNPEIKQHDLGRDRYGETVRLKEAPSEDVASTETKSTKSNSSDANTATGLAAGSSAAPTQPTLEGKEPAPTPAAPVLAAEVAAPATGFRVSVSAIIEKVAADLSFFKALVSDVATGVAMKADIKANNQFKPDIILAKEQDGAPSAPAANIARSLSSIDVSAIRNSFALVGVTIDTSTKEDKEKKSESAAKNLGPNEITPISLGHLATPIVPTIAQAHGQDTPSMTPSKSLMS